MPIDGVGAKLNVMNNLGLPFFVPYESFPYLELIYRMTLHMNQQGYQIDGYKEWLVVDAVEYKPMGFMNYFPTAIINAFIIPNSWSNKMKKLVDLKQEANDFKKNSMIMFSWITKRYEDNKDQLYPIYKTTFFTRSLDREVIKVLVVILGLKTKIEVDTGVVLMAYNIIQAYRK